MYECKFSRFSYLEFPEQILEAALREEFELVSEVVRSLMFKTNIPSTILEMGASWLGGNTSEDLRLGVLGMALGGASIVQTGLQAALPENILQVVSARLEDSDTDVRRLAINALGTGGDPTRCGRTTRG